MFNDVSNYLKVFIFGIIILGLSYLGYEIHIHKYYKPSDDLGYYLGLVGGLMMATLLLYTIRKNLKIFRRVGDIKYWFAIHMMFGILGPLFIIFHSAFHINTANAMVAFVAMCIVSGSGIIGRFAYNKIHHGLFGFKIELSELRGYLDDVANNIYELSELYPDFLNELDALTEKHLIYNVSLPRKHFNLLKFRQDSAKLLKKSEKLFENERYIRDEMMDITNNYIDSIDKALQYTIYENIFSLWHIMHIPLVYILFITGIWHVIAVHMY